MSIDLKKYRYFADRFDLSEEEKAELVKGVFSIMECFVDQAFNLHPLQKQNECQGKTDLQELPESLESKTPSP